MTTEDTNEIQKEFETKSAFSNSLLENEEPELSHRTYIGDTG